ncbi:MAG: zinc dependent phospholipase C family protein [Deltaproteobacteria bacterium]|nr:zinc dependent phospholipase C family protein [Deltaproteobacteria bacterium]
MIQFIFVSGAWAWGPAIHTVIACTILDELGQILPSIAHIIQSFSLEYIYGNMAADFFIGKGQKKRADHPHNWETGFRFLAGAKDEREAAYAYGFLSHLAADVVAHNYFVPELIHRFYTWKRIGHLRSEAMADQFAGSFYIRIAREILTMKELDCDALLKSVVKRNKHGLKARRSIFTQSVKISDYLYCLPRISFKRTQRVSEEYLVFMIDLSYRLVRNLLSYPDSSPCLAHDPIGSDNLQLASQNGVLSRLLNHHSPRYQFPVDQRLLRL